MQQTRQYSRLAKVEEQKNKRTAKFYVFLTIVFIAFLAIFGLRVLSAVAKFITDVNSDGVTTQVGDTTPPAPPSISTPNSFTNSADLNIQGSAEAGSTVVLFINDDKKELLADAEASFSTSVTLQKGENIIFAKATDRDGNESASSAHYTVVYDSEKPTVEVTKPKDGDKFYGDKQKQITLEGKTEADARVTINDRVTILDSAGQFRFPTTLGDGENSFNIKSTDQAGNQTELTIYLTFVP